MQTPTKAIDSKLAREYIRALIDLKDLEVGVTVTKKHVEAVRHFLGPLLDQIKPCKIEVSFDEHGVASVDDPDGVISFGEPTK